MVEASSLLLGINGDGRITRAIGRITWERDSVPIPEGSVILVISRSIGAAPDENSSVFLRTFVALQAGFPAKSVCLRRTHSLSHGLRCCAHGFRVCCRCLRSPPAGARAQWP